jgi:hypothetical protein
VVQNVLGFGRGLGWFALAAGIAYLLDLLLGTDAATFVAWHPIEIFFAVVFGGSMIFAAGAGLIGWYRHRAK